MKKKTTKRGEPGESGPLTTWSLRGRTYVATTAKRGLEPLDQDRAESMTDEGGPARLEPVAETRGASGSG